MKISKLLTGILTVLLLSFTVSAVLPAIASTLRVVQTPKLSLYAGISSSAVTMRITPYPKDLDGTKLTMTDLGTLPTVTVDPGIKNIEEIIGFTAITDNGDNTATLTGLARDIISKYPYTTTGTGRAHNASAVVVFGNNPQIYGRLAAKENNETVTGLWSFTGLSPIGPTATATNQFVTYGQMIGVVASGAATATQAITGISRLATAVQQASSTLTTSNIPLVVQAQNASSSPTNSCKDGTTLSPGQDCSVVAGDDGKINSNYVGTSSAYTYNWSASTTFNSNLAANSTTTLSATTTIAGNATTSKPLTINNVKYGFPSSNGASSSVLTNDAQGDLLWLPRSGKGLATSSVSASTVTITGDTNEDNVLLLTLPGNVLSTNNAVHIRMFVGETMSATTQTWRIYYGGTVTSIPVTSGGGIGLAKGYMDFYIVANNSTASQLVSGAASLIADFAGFSNGAAIAIISVSTPTGSAAIDSTIAQPIRITSQNTAAGTSFSMYYYTVEVIN